MLADRKLVDLDERLRRSASAAARARGRCFGGAARSRPGAAALTGSAAGSATSRSPPACNGCSGRVRAVGHPPLGQTRSARSSSGGGGRPSCWGRWTAAARQERVEKTLAKRHLERGGLHALRPLRQLPGGAELPLGLAWLPPRRRRASRRSIRADLLAPGPPRRDRGLRRPDPDDRRCPRGLAEAEALRDGGVVVFGDRGMVTQAHATSPPRRGSAGSARSGGPDPQAVVAGDLQLSLFDEPNLAEIASPSTPASGSSSAATPPSPPSGRASARDLLQATEAELPKVKAIVEGPRGRCAMPTPARSASAPDGSATATRSPNTSSSRSQTAASRSPAKPSRSTRRPRSTAST